MKKHYKFFLRVCGAFSILLSPAFLYAQQQTPPPIQWEKCYGGSSSDDENNIQQTKDGGLIIAGSSASNDGDVTGHHGSTGFYGTGDYWIVKTDIQGNIQWEHSFGGTYEDEASCIRQTRDGGYIVAGVSGSINGDVTGHHGDTNNTDYWIVKLDSVGNMQWEKSLGGTRDDIAASVYQTYDDGYVIAGTSNSIDGDVTGHHGSPDSSDCWIVKLDSSGNIQWGTSLGGTNNDYASSIQQTRDSGYIIAGRSFSTNGDITGHHGNSNTSDYWIVKLDINGKIQWEKSLGGSLFDESNSIQQTRDGGYIVVGNTTSNDGDVTGNHGGIDYWIVKLDPIGNIQWQKCYGGSGAETEGYVSQTNDGGYIVSGTSTSNDGEVTGHKGIFNNYWIVKINSIGDILWEKSLGGTNDNEARNAIQLKDGSYVVAGITDSDNGDVTGFHDTTYGQYDYWIVKFAPTISPPSAPVISYLIPDIGTPGMNTYTEIIGPYNKDGNFGTDGMYLNNPGDYMQVVCANPADTNKITIGPAVVSWNGKMVSTQVFVHPNVQPNSDDWQQLDPAYRIPVMLILNGASITKTDTFYIVRPQPFILANGPGALGSGNGWGIRSRRGAMIVDSMELDGAGTYTIDTSDCDPGTPGNQGFLPAVILSKGRISVAPGAVISVDGDSMQAGPGGGGGGGGYYYGSNTGVPQSWGGNGYSGGQGALLRGGNGTGAFGNPDTSMGGMSLNGMPGATDVPGCIDSQTPGGQQGTGGGSGFPFGTSGQGGWNDSLFSYPCYIDTCKGGYSGGSGAMVILNYVDSAGQSDVGGGGGGNATPGTATTSGGGFICGNAMLVPFFGGSGGASGNSVSGVAGNGPRIIGFGGGGAGAVTLYGTTGTDLSLVSAQGARGGDMTIKKEVDTTGSENGGGGGGSGGGIIISSKLFLQYNAILVNGGDSGIAYQPNFTGYILDGGVGGAGRVRLDGPQPAAISVQPAGASQYRGPSTDTSQYVIRTFTLTGTGNSQPINIYIKPESGLWQLAASVTNYGTAWSQQITLPGKDSLYYLVAAQQVPNPNTTRYTREPAWVLSQAAANILHVSGSPVISSVQNRTLPDLRCTTEEPDTVFIRNSGTGALDLATFSFTNGNAGFSLLSPLGDSIQVAPLDSLPVVVLFSPSAAGAWSDTLIIANNDTNAGHNPWKIALRGIKDSIGFSLGGILNDTIDLKHIACGTAKDSSFAITNTSSVGVAFTLHSSDRNLTMSSSAYLQPGAQIVEDIHFSGIAAPGIYLDTLTVTDTCGHAQTAILTVTVDSMPIRITGATAFCPGDTVVLDAGGGYTSYRWSTGATTQTIAVTTPGDYDVIATDGNCAGRAPDVTVTEYPAATASITASGDTLTSTPASTYQWFMNGNDIPGATSQQYIALRSGTYMVSITDGNGCSATAERYLEVIDTVNVCIELGASAITIGKQDLFATVYLLDPISLPVDSISFTLTYDPGELEFVMFDSSLCRTLWRLVRPGEAVVTLSNCGEPMQAGALVHAIFLPLIKSGDTITATMTIDSIAFYPVADSIVPLGCSAQVTIVPPCGISSIDYNSPTSLSQNYPNPFTGTTTIHVTLSQSDVNGAQLKVYNILGEEVADLTDQLTPNVNIPFVAKKSKGGVYYYTLQAASGRITRQMFVVK